MESLVQSSPVWSPRSNLQLHTRKRLPWLRHLVAGYRMEEASGIRRDVSGNGLHLDAFNSPGVAPGVRGNAASFTAANSEYLSSSDSAFALPQIGIACWAQIKNTTETHAIVGKWLAGVDESAYTLFLPSGNQQPRASFSLDGSTKTSVDVSKTLQVNTWYFFYYAFDGATARNVLIEEDGTEHSNTESLSGSLHPANTPFDVAEINSAQASILVDLLFVFDTDIYNQPGAIPFLAAGGDPTEP